MVGARVTVVCEIEGEKNSKKKKGKRKIVKIGLVNWEMEEPKI